MNRALALLLFFTSSALWGTVTSTNNGDGTTRLRADYTIPTTKAVDIRDDICRGAGWTATIECTDAAIAAGACTAGQRGSQVANPETCLQAIDRKVRLFLRELRKAGEVREAVETFVQPVTAADSSADIQ